MTQRPRDDWDYVESAAADAEAASHARALAVALVVFAGGMAAGAWLTWLLVS